MKFVQAFSLRFSTPALNCARIAHGGGRRPGNEAIIAHAPTNAHAHLRFRPRIVSSTQTAVIPSVCLSVTTFSATIYAQQGGQKAIPTGSVPHWFDFLNGDFRKSTAFMA